MVIHALKTGRVTIQHIGEVAQSWRPYTVKEGYVEFTKKGSVSL